MGTPVTLLTCTRDRPGPFELCQRWVTRMVLAAPGNDIRWVVVDDGDVPITWSLRPPCEITYLRRAPSQAGNTLALNLIEAIPHLRGATLTIEDDDWYHADYIPVMLDRLTRGHLTGQMPTLYWHVLDRAWHISPVSSGHVSLFRTGFLPTAYPHLLAACEEAERQATPWVDLYFWGEARRGNLTARRWMDSITFSLGIKGQPGRGGLGSNHRRGVFRNPDPAGHWLARQIGADAAVYLQRYPPTGSESTAR